LVPEPPRLLLVEDEPGLVRTLTDRLTAEGYAVESVGNAETALQSIVRGNFDAILLDVMLPGGSGFDVCRTVRQQGIQTPILILTARGELVDRVVGLKLGADDYLVKPFDMAELLARIEALLRRRIRPPSRAVLRCGDIVIDLRRAEVSKSGRIVELSVLEFRLLRYLAERPGEAISREELLNQVWGYDAMPSSRTVDVHIAWLRQKLEDNPRHPQYLLTVHGIGYKFSAGSS
jgi:two-component system alkaline phosphatase synthesis response regulator PhoP